MKHLLLILALLITATTITCCAQDQPLPENIDSVQAFKLAMSDASFWSESSLPPDGDAGHHLRVAGKSSVTSVITSLIASGFFFAALRVNPRKVDPGAFAIFGGAFLALSIGMNINAGVHLAKAGNAL